MNILKRIFSRRSTSPLGPLRNAKLYYNETTILVLAVYWDVAGFEAGGEPRLSLPLYAAPTLIGEMIVRAMEASRSGLSKDELRSVEQAMFSFAGVRNWGELERRWQLIDIDIEPGRDCVSIKPMRHGADGGYVLTKDDPVYSCIIEPEAIGSLVKNIIHGAPVESFSLTRDDPHKSEDGKERSVNIPFSAGDRVEDSWGNRGSIAEIDPMAEHGLGVVRVRFDDGRTLSVSAIASGLTRIFVADKSGSRTESQ